MMPKIVENSTMNEINGKLHENAIFFGSDMIHLMVTIPKLTHQMVIFVLLKVLIKFDPYNFVQIVLQIFLTAPTYFLAASIKSTKCEMPNDSFSLN